MRLQHWIKAGWRKCAEWSAIKRVAAKWQRLRTLGTTHHVDRMKDWLPSDSPPSTLVLSVYEDLYRAQTDVRENFPARLQIPLALALPLLTAQGFLFFAARHVQGSWASYTFYLFLGLAVLNVFYAGVVFLRVSSGHLYQYLPTPLEVETFRARLRSYYEANPTEDCRDNEDVARHVNLWAEKDIRRHYVICTSVNAELNGARSNAILAIHKILFNAILLTIIAFFCFVLGDLKDQPIHRAQVQMVEKVGPNLPIVIFQGIRTIDVDAVWQ